MTTTLLDIMHAGPQVSLQDGGRKLAMRYGVPRSGPMDRFAFTIANLAVGNFADAPAIEVSLGGLTLRCTQGSVSFAVAGGDFQSCIDTTSLPPWCVATLKAGETLTIRLGRWGRWCYLAFGGQLRCTKWLGSASTHGPSGLGGGSLVAGSPLQIDDTRDGPDVATPLACPVSARPRAAVRVVIGPQERFFTPSTVERFLAGPFTVTDASDRMGVRLKGPALPPAGPLDMPSEPILRGSVQVSGDGVATVLLADHQTTGGYPKIATVVSDDLDGFAQRRSHNPVIFTAISPDAALQAMRTRHLARSQYLTRFQSLHPASH